MRKADIAREFDFNRGWVTQLSSGGRNQIGTDPDWPAPTSPGHWSLDDVREFLRRRAKRLRPLANYCSNCGAPL